VLEVSFLAAFLGGVLSLLAPCSALLLPAFFANAFTSPTQLLGRTVLLLAGLSTVFVPLGLGASLVAGLLLDHRETTILVAGLLLVGFGLLELAGGGFSLAPAGWLGRFGGGRSAAAVYATGLVYGVSGFCAGPLLGAVLTIAGSAANPFVGGALLFAYALGTAAPLFLVAWLWDRYGLGRRAWLRGRPLRIAGYRLHSTRLASGALFVLLGVVFIAFQGGSGLGGLYEDLGLGELGFRAQAWVGATLGRVPDLVWLAALGLVAGGFWLARRRRGEPAPATDPTSRRAA
jgi:cytochrome c biogenesis protein CcdA